VDQQEGQLLAGRLLPLGSAAVLPHQRALIDHVGLGRSGAAELVGPGQLCHQCIEQKKCLADEQCARRLVVQVSLALSLYLSIYLFNCLPIYLTIYRSIDLSNYRSI
jgi:hypothetical protein